MAIPKKVIGALAEKYDSFYVYDEQSIIDRTGRLKRAFPDIALLYSIKCNSNPQVVRSVFSQGFGADAASLGEVEIAAGSGLAPGEIYYSAPGKSDGDILGAIDKAAIIADSIGELHRIERIAAGRNTTLEIGVRIHPCFSFGGGAAAPSKFGIDEDQAISFLQGNRCPHIKVTGIHVHLRSQELNAEVIAQYYKNILGLAERIERLTSVELKYINLGSGIGLPYAAADAELDMGVLASALRAAPRNPGTRVMIEVGRYAVCKSGIYVTKVLDKKVSCGKTYIILSNTLNGFLRPSLAKLVERYAGKNPLSGSEPLYTGKGSFGFSVLEENRPKETVTLVGNLCTAADVIAEDISMPRLEPGEVVMISNAGAYGLVLSPLQFSSQRAPAEIFLSRHGTVVEPSPASGLPAAAPNRTAADNFSKISSFSR